MGEGGNGGLKIIRFVGMKGVQTMLEKKRGETLAWGWVGNRGLKVMRFVGMKAMRERVHGGKEAGEMLAWGWGETGARKSQDL